jgi:hypothetical protein
MVHISDHARAVSFVNEFLPDLQSHFVAHSQQLATNLVFDVRQKEFVNLVRALPPRIPVPRLLQQSYQELLRGKAAARSPEPSAWISS